MIYAKMVKDEYVDLVPNYPYEVERIYGGYTYVKLKGSPRRYKSECFKFFIDGDAISQEEAYRRQQIDKVKKKLGFKK